MNKPLPQVNNKDYANGYNNIDWGKKKMNVCSGCKSYFPYGENIGYCHLDNKSPEGKYDYNYCGKFEVSNAKMSDK